MLVLKTAIRKRVGALLLAATAVCVAGCKSADPVVAKSTKPAPVSEAASGSQTIQFDNNSTQKIPAQALDAESTSSTPANGPAGQQE